MADEMVATPVEEVVEQEVVDTPEGDVAEVVDPKEQAEVAEPEEITGDHRTIPGHLREFFKTPEGKDAKTAWFERSAFREQFPDGPKQAAEIMQILAEYGGREGIGEKFGELQGSVKQLEELDQMIATGDVKVLDKFIQQSPEGFSKLAPEVMSKFYQVAPEECNKMLCGVIANTFNQAVGDTDASLGMNLALASKMIQLGQGDEALSILTKIQQWSKSFASQAQAPSQQKPAKTADTSVADERKQWEAEKWTQSLNAKVGEIGSSIVQNELKPFIKDRELSATKQELVNEAIDKRLDKALKSDVAFQKNIMSFVNSKDLDGAAKLYRSKLGEITPNIAQLVAREMLGSPASKPVVKPAAPKAPSSTAPKADADPRKALFSEIFAR